MKHILHLVSGEGEHVKLAQKVIELEKNVSDLKVTVIQLGTEPASVDYHHLLQAIFTADSVQAW